MCNSGNLLRTQFERFVDQQLVEPSIFPQNERVIEARHQKDVMHFEGHQVFEAFKAFFGVENPLGHPRHTHVSISALIFEIAKNDTGWISSTPSLTSLIKLLNRDLDQSLIQHRVRH